MWNYNKSWLCSFGGRTISSKISERVWVCSNFFSESCSKNLTHKQLSFSTKLITNCNVDWGKVKHCEALLWERKSQLQGRDSSSPALLTLSPSPGFYPKNSLLLPANYLWRPMPFKPLIWEIPRVWEDMLVIHFFKKCFLFVLLLFTSTAAKTQP